MTDPERRLPRRVYGGGHEPDPRFSLANERTFLAWIRTTLALLAGAAAVHVLELSVSDAVQRAASALLGLSGLVCAVHAWMSWANTERALRHGLPLPSNAVGFLLAGTVAMVAVVMIVLGVRG
ncbi:YidH family protein [Aeromicrobium sp.]|uniref:YidH family protein n=1 Tax=Aeromicrobium sp. TaxID=1871063 RepID=UPI003D6B9D00